MSQFLSDLKNTKKGSCRQEKQKTSAREQAAVECEVPEKVKAAEELTRAVEEESRDSNEKMKIAEENIKEADDKTRDAEEKIKAAEQVAKATTDART